VGRGSRTTVPGRRGLPHERDRRGRRAGRCRDRSQPRAGHRLGGERLGGAIGHGLLTDRRGVYRLREGPAVALPAGASRLPGRRRPPRPAAPHGARGDALPRSPPAAVEASGPPRAAWPRPEGGGGALPDRRLAQRARLLGHRRAGAPIHAPALSLARRPDGRGGVRGCRQGQTDLRRAAGPSAGASTPVRGSADDLSVDDGVSGRARSARSRRRPRAGRAAAIGPG
jgi:hypothetical protein